MDEYLELTLKASNALDIAMDKLLEVLKDNIERIVYGAGTPEFYSRSFEFLKSWETSRSIIKGNLVTSELFQNVLDMTFDADNFFHGSNYYKQNDITAFLSNIIFEGLSGPMFGDGFWTHARDAWTPTMALLYDGTFLRWFEDAMAMQGSNGSTFSISFT